jgi:DNA-binding NarL/FixJ family response regulator
VPALAVANSLSAVATDEPARTAAGRADDLERRLRRISEELRVAGFGSGASDVDGPRELPELAELSSRQWEVLERLLRGERVPGIAGRMFLSQSTVRNHLAAIYRHLGVNSQEELLTLLSRRRAPGPPTGKLV